MPYMNMCVLTGHLTRDAEFRFTANGTGVTNFDVAVTRAFDKDKTDFFKVTCWNRGNYKLAEWTGDLPKGKLVTVQGEMQVNEYNGNKYPNLIADKVIFEKEKTNTAPQGEPAEAPEEPNTYEDDMTDEFEVPF